MIRKDKKLRINEEQTIKQIINNVDYKLFP